MNSQFKFLKNKYLYSVIFLLTIILQLYIMWLCNNNKGDLYIDEYYTFNFVSSNFSPILLGEFKDYNYWLSSDYWWKLLTIQEGEQFNYSAVYYNTAKDVHPPLYYFLIHTVYSFFTETWNPNIAIIVNMILFVATEIVMFIICERLYASKVWSLLCCALYGFSLGAINSFVLIRMYGLLVFLSVLYFLFVLLYDKEYSRKWLVAIFVINIVGFLTHYYFIIFATAMFGLLIYRMYIKEKVAYIKEILFIDLLSLVICVMLFPVCLEHILGGGANGYRGQQAFKGLMAAVKTDEFSENVLWFLDNMSVLPLLVLAIVINILKNKNLQVLKNSFLCFCNKNSLIKQLLVVLSVTLIIISRISPFTEMRYYSVLFPFICIIITYFVKENFVLSKISSFFTICFCCVFLFYEMVHIYKYREITPFLSGDRLTGQVSREWLHEQGIKKCVLLLDNKEVCFLVYNMNLLKNSEYTYIATKGDPIDLKKNYNEKLLVYVEGEVSKEECRRFLEERYKFKVLTTEKESRLVDAVLCTVETLNKN